MQRKLLTLLAVPVVALAIAVSAVAIVPGMLTALSPGPAATSIATPAWKVGDRWTYNVSLAPTGEDQVLPQELMTSSPTTVAPLVLGTLTETVAGTVSTDAGPAWNTTLSGELTFGPPAPMTTVQGTVAPLSLRTVSVSGFVWLRQSDLAPVYSEKSVQLDASWTLSFGNGTWSGMLSNATYSLMYDSTTQVWYHPPLTIWQFPLEENTTWAVRSNATIHYASTFAISGPNVTFETNHSATFTVPVDFSMHTGFFENVTTPAGTFRALPVSAFRGTTFPEVPDRDASAMMNLTGETDLAIPRGLATSWFSAQVGNVVKANTFTEGFEGPRIEMDLVSYTFS
jgi:hypothetical protein